MTDVINGALSKTLILDIVLKYVYNIFCKLKRKQKDLINKFDKLPAIEVCQVLIYIFILLNALHNKRKEHCK